MKVFLGKSKFADKTTRQHFPVVWDSERIVNGHIALIGGSGTGKTYNLRKLMRQMIGKSKKENKHIRFHVLDVHGDIEIPGASSISFSETMGNGLNPLKISSDKEFGGVRKKIRSFISALQKTSRPLGSKQEACLLNLMTDLYMLNDFHANNPASWDVNFQTRKMKNGKKMPTLSDLVRFNKFKLQSMITGSSGGATIKLDALMKKVRQMSRQNVRLQTKEDEEKLAKTKMECKELYAEFIDSIETGREIDDVIKYNSRDVLQSTYERLTILESSGIFSDRPPVFEENSAVWRYDIKSLNPDEQLIFVNLLLEDLFFNAKQSGQKEEPDTFIVIDEAHKFVSDDEGQIINILAKEARKFGIGLILASQSFSHFPEDIIANTSTKIILGLDEMFHDSSARKLKIEAKRFSYIQAHKTAMVQVKNKGDMSNRFIDIILEDN